MSDQAADLAENMAELFHLRKELAHEDSINPDTVREALCRIITVLEQTQNPQDEPERPHGQRPGPTPDTPYESGYDRALRATGSRLREEFRKNI